MREFLVILCFLFSGLAFADPDPLIKYKKINTWHGIDPNDITRHRVHLRVTRVIQSPKIPRVGLNLDVEAGKVRKFIEEKCPQFLNESFGSTAPTLNPGLQLDRSPSPKSRDFRSNPEITSFKLVRNSQLFESYKEYGRNEPVLVVNAICNR